jgi:ATP-dependent RNA helicase DeaD
VPRRGRERADGAERSRNGNGERPKQDWEVARLYIGAGRKAKIRPGDLVGAIANETGLDARAIGSIQIADRFSLVEVPEASADAIIEVLRTTTIKGKKVPVRRDRDGA